MIQKHFEALKSDQTALALIPARTRSEDDVSTTSSDNTEPSPQEAPTVVWWNLDKKSELSDQINSLHERMVKHQKGAAGGPVVESNPATDNPNGNNSNSSVVSSLQAELREAQSMLAEQGVY